MLDDEAAGGRGRGGKVNSGECRSGFRRILAEMEEEYGGQRAYAVYYGTVVGSGGNTDHTYDGGIYFLGVSQKLC